MPSGLCSLAPRLCATPLAGTVHVQGLRLAGPGGAPRAYPSSGVPPRRACRPRPRKYWPSIASPRTAARPVSVSSLPLQ